MKILYVLMKVRDSYGRKKLKADLYFHSHVSQSCMTKIAWILSVIARWHPVLYSAPSQKSVLNRFSLCCLIGQNSVHMFVYAEQLVLHVILQKIIHSQKPEVAK